MLIFAPNILCLSVVICKYLSLLPPRFPRICEVHHYAGSWEHSSETDTVPAHVAYNLAKIKTITNKNKNIIALQWPWHRNNLSPPMEEWIKKTWYICYLHKHWNITQPQKWNNAICSYMNGPTANRLSYWVKHIRERHIIVQYHWFMESKIQHKWTCLQNRKRLTDIEDRLLVARGKGAGEGWIGSWGELMPTITYRMDKQPGPTV